MSIGRFLFRLARSIGGLAVARVAIHYILTYMSFLLPVERLYESALLVAFHHPQPSHFLHILLVPKRPLSSLDSLTAADADFMVDLFTAVQQLTRQFNRQTTGYRLVVNGGAYQEVPHLHFHLIAD